MKVNSLTLCSLKKKLCRLTQEIYQTDAIRTKTTHNITQSISAPNTGYMEIICYSFMTSYACMTANIQAENKQRRAQLKLIWRWYNCILGCTDRIWVSREYLKAIFHLCYSKPIIYTYIDIHQLCNNSTLKNLHKTQTTVGLFCRIWNKTLLGPASHV